jgi:hypothetical protein
MQLPTTVDEENRGHYTLKYEVVTDGVMGHRALANAAAASSPHPLPVWGDTYSYSGDSDSTSYARTFTVESREGHNNRYFVTVHFNPIEGSPTDYFEPNPILRPPLIWADRETFTRIVEKAVTPPEGRTDATLVNACGRQYDVPLELEDTHGVIVVEFNVATLREVLEYQRFLRRAVNKIPWDFRGVVFPERTVLAREVASGPQLTQGSYQWFHVVCRFVVADGDDESPEVPGGKNWDVSLLEHGYQYYLRDPNKANEFFTDGKGNKLHFPREGAPKPHDEPLSEPVNLAADGTRLDDGQIGVYTDFRVYREVDFNLLPFS